jgi:hypothetical protein
VVAVLVPAVDSAVSPHKLLPEYERATGSRLLDGEGLRWKRGIQSPAAR